MKEHVLPAIRNMKDLEKSQTDYKVCVLLDMHVGHLSIIELLKNMTLKHIFILI